jgi:hypothetical protein
MQMQKFQIIFVSLLFYAIGGFCHPTGNLITLGEHVLWSYINPINDPNHHACIMIWTKDTSPKVFLQSEEEASDFMLSTTKNEIYIIERKYVQSTDHFEIRVLKSTIESQPHVLWDWFSDEYRIGEGGFFMFSDTEMVFGKYPGIFILKKGGTPQKYFEFPHPIKRIRSVEKNLILLLSDSACFLTRPNGNLIKQWDQLIENNIENAPLHRNQIFDADYANEELLLAYWGKRSYDLIYSDGNRKTIEQQSEPLTPHWVAFWKNNKLLFSSKLIFDGTTPQPHLILLNEQNKPTVIWNSP